MSHLLSNIESHVASAVAAGQGAVDFPGLEEPVLLDAGRISYVTCCGQAQAGKSTLLRAFLKSKGM